MDQPHESLEEDFKAWASQSHALKSIERLPGDASSRRYYRATMPKGESCIIMKMEPFAEQGPELPFLAVQRHLKSIEVDVPQVYDFDPQAGLILLEDLGDVTLLRKLQKVSDMEVERHFYEQVLDQLVLMQYRGSPSAKASALEAFKLRFDFEKLMWEVQFAIEHFYEKHLKRSIKEKDKSILKKQFGEICKAIADEPTVFTHRDFHSRNIMIVPKPLRGEERIVMIDFQDARLGPAQYDLASLLKDSYYQLEEAQVLRLIDYYVARWEGLSGNRVERIRFKRIFDFMAVQRNFKAIGSFASFLNSRENPTYLKYIGNTFENIRRTLLGYPEYAPLREVLFHYYYF